MNDNNQPPDNPFSVPNTGDRSRQPLNPCAYEEHIKYYVPVDDTEEAFNTFTRQLGDATSLDRQGRLVVVDGESGCGKTSLIHRCVDHACAALKTREQRPVIIDLTADRMEKSTTEDRLQTVCHRVVRHLRRELPNVGDIGTGDRYDVYDELSAALSAVDTVALIVLPPCPDTVVHLEHDDPRHRSRPRATAEELSDYVGYARPRIMFFAESSDVSGIADWLRGLREVDRDEVVSLSVGCLKKGDGWLFVQKRLARLAESERRPDFQEEAMRQLVTDQSFWSVTKLQALLFGVWEHAREKNPPLETITYNDITAYHFEIAHRRPRDQRR